MTGQISDSVLYQGHEYSLTRANGTGLFQPTDLGLRVAMLSTACWHGFITGYAVSDELLTVTDLQLGLVDDDGEFLNAAAAPELDGVAPVPDGHCGALHYRGLRMPSRFSGSLMIGRDFITDLYVHMGIQRPWKYGHLHELILQNGRLIEAYDRSAEARRLRDLGDN